MPVAVQQMETPSAGPETDTLADSVILLLALTVVQRTVAFGRSLLFCRWLGAEDLGQWDMVLSFLSLAAPVAVLGLLGSFGRYTERYRQQGRLRSFFRRTAVFTLVSGLAAGLVVFSANRWFSQLIFGVADRSQLVALVAVVLAVLILHNYLFEFFNGLRRFRMVCLLQFFHAIAFAVCGCLLLVSWQRSVMSLVMGYGLAYLFAIAMLTPFFIRVWRRIDDAATSDEPASMWRKLLPYAAWLWMTNWVANLFQVVDRYMIVHYSGMSAAEALEQVGNYHTSRLVPMLLVSVAMMLGTMITPHLAADWEAGRRREVAARINLILKTAAFCLSAIGGIVLAASPLLYEVVLQGRFTPGAAVLPWTMTYCAWSGLMVIAQNYLLCAEKVRLSGLALFIGLLVNIVLNLLLMPRFGLAGAVMATTAANFTAIVLYLLFSRALGMTIHPGTVVMTLLPGVLCLGHWPALVAVAAVAVTALATDALFTRSEKLVLAGVFIDYMVRLRNLFTASASRAA